MSHASQIAWGTRQLVWARYYRGFNSWNVAQNRSLLGFWTQYCVIWFAGEQRALTTTPSPLSPRTRVPIFSAKQSAGLDDVGVPG